MPGDYFHADPLLLMGSLTLSAAGGGWWGWTRTGRTGRAIIAFTTVLSIAFWAFVSRNWWATSPPR